MIIKFLCDFYHTNKNIAKYVNHNDSSILPNKIEYSTVERAFKISCRQMKTKKIGNFGEEK